METLQDVETKLARWTKRLTRASNEVAKLERKRRRMAAQAGMPRSIPVRKAKVGWEFEEALPLRCPDKPDDLTIPAELDRRIPAVAEEMTAARKRAEAEARSKMPLTGRAALKAIRKKA